MRIALGDVSLNVEESGEGDVLVLIHGLGNSLHLWDPVVTPLSNHHRVVRYDVRGFGESDKPAGPYSTAMFADDLRALLDSLSIATAHVLGISMGGVIAQQFALSYPERLRSLILASTSSEVGEKPSAAWQRLAAAIERRGFDERSADASRAFGSEFVARHPQVVRDVALQNARNDPRAYAAAARAVADYNFTEALRNLRVPVLLLQGLDDRMTPPGGAVRMRRALPRARLLMVEAAGHNLPIEMPALFAHTVAAFTGGIELSRR